MKTILSIVILNYNTKKLTFDLLDSIEKNYETEVKSGKFQVIAADNDSPDRSIDDLNNFKKNTIISDFVVCDNKANMGFSKGNNRAIKYAKGKYVLILNPDTLAHKNTLNRMIEFMEGHPEAGAATCKILYADGAVDQNCVRGFPTPWNSFCHFSGLSRVFPGVKLFNGYLQSGWRNLDKIQEVEAIEGAFMIIPKELGDSIGWFDEDYFFYGEDLQLCFDILKSGKKIFFVPDATITHFGGASSGIKKQTQKLTTADIETKKRVQKFRFEAMRLFYKKNYSKSYPQLLRLLVFKGIDFLYNRKLAQLSTYENRN